MLPNGHEANVAINGDYYRGAPNGRHTNEENKPTYALEHLATFKVKSNAEIDNPQEKMKLLVELDKTGGIWPQKMYMCFNGPWLVMLDSDMKEIENFPGSLITEPTAFISTDLQETFNNILIFNVPGISLGNTEMHIFQVSDVSAIHLVEDLQKLKSGQIVTIDRNKTPINLPKPDKTGKDQYGIAMAAAEVAAEKNAHDQEQSLKDIQVLNHCFEDIERFMARLHYAAEALHELESRKDEHSPHGEGLLILRSRPPIESEFQDILAKIKLAINYVVKLQNHFDKVSEPIHNVFLSLQTIVNVSYDVYPNANLPQNVINPLLRRETVTFLGACLTSKENEFWQSLGPNWTVPKDQFKDQRHSFHPIFYDDWSPDWVVDEEVPYLPPAIRKSITTQPERSPVWLQRLQSRNVKIAEVLYNKTANNDRELNCTKGEYLEIIDDSRKWWKARNSAGGIGFVPSTILVPYNFDPSSAHSGKDTESLASSIETELNGLSNQNNNNHQRNNLSVYAASTDDDAQSARRSSVPRSISMPNVPIPPPPPPTDSAQITPSGTIRRNMAAAGAMAAMRARTDADAADEALMRQSSVNDELKFTLMQRERRRDLEILKTPQIYINQQSTPREVEDWLRGKGFPNNIIHKLRGLSGEELFTLSPHTIENYFGQKESRRLISQIVLQKNICEYKTIRSSELNAKLAKVRQKVDTVDPNEVF